MEYFVRSGIFDIFIFILNNFCGPYISFHDLSFLFIINIVGVISGIICEVIVWLNHSEIDFIPILIYLYVLNDMGYVIKSLNIIVIIINHLKELGICSICSGNDNQVISDPDIIIINLIVKMGI